MNKLSFAAVAVAATLGGAMFVDPPVNLQASTPGTQQVGNANISGRLMAGSIRGTDGTNGAIVITGDSTNASGAGYGGLFKSAAQNGRGVRGYASHTSGFGIGGDFQSDGPGGTAVRAIATAGSGASYGVFAKASSPPGFAGFFDGRLKVTGAAEILGTLTAASYSGNGSGLSNVKPSGTAGGDLSGTYPSPTIAANAVGPTELANDKTSLGKMTGSAIQVDGAGRAGIGTGANTLTQKLTLESGLFAVTKGAGQNRVVLGTDAGFRGMLTLSDTANTPQVTLNITPANVGQVVADVKNFRTENPDDIQTDIWYASVEGPEAAAYVRGTAKLVNGRAVVRFPAHFRAVAVAEGMTVQLTPQSIESLGLAVVSKSVDGITVGELNRGTGSYEFDWEVKCVRKGFEDYQVIRPWDAGYLPEDRAAAWKARQQLYQRGSLAPSKSK